MFNILSIDGGGIRGIIPAKVLSLVEDELICQGKSTKIADYFDMICGTSTGGIIAIGLSLGLSAKEILALYVNHAADIFPYRNKYSKIIGGLRNKPFYRREKLQELLDKVYNKQVADGIARIGHAQTRLCIPIYDAGNGRVRVLKTSHHDELDRDFQIPATYAALGTAAAPVYFDSLDYKYTETTGKSVQEIAHIDGGVFANNPSLIGYIEATCTLNVNPADLGILSLGTGNRLYTETQKRAMGMKYWIWHDDSVFALYDMMSSAQADNADNYMKFFQRGVGVNGHELFPYLRVQHRFENEKPIPMDTSDAKVLKELENIGAELFKAQKEAIMTTFMSSTKPVFTPCHKL